MTISGRTWDISDAALLALTPTERWSAARRIHPTFVSEYGLVILVGLILLLLTVLLWWVTFRRDARTVDVPRELFTKHAARKGLSPRAHQILLAIVGRSGLRQSHLIFTNADAFGRGATRLLAECAATRTLPENEQLRAEVAQLSKRLGFRSVEAVGTPVASKGADSRSIPVGKALDLVWPGDRRGIGLKADVVRNDNFGLVVELRRPFQSQVGDSWCVRYYSGKTVCEFDTRAIRCEGNRLTLEHSDKIRSVNQRRFPPVPMNGPALVGPLPLFRDIPTTNDNAGRSLEGPALVEAVVVESAGPDLQVKTRLDVQPGDRVLVVFDPVVTLRSGAEDGIQTRRRIMQGVGLVTRCRDVGREMVITLELTGLSDTEIDAVVAMMSSARDRGGVSANVGRDEQPEPQTVMNAEAMRGAYRA